MKTKKKMKKKRKKKKLEFCCQIQTPTALPTVKQLPITRWLGTPRPTPAVVVVQKTKKL